MQQVIKTYEEALEFIDKTGFLTFTRNPLGHPSLADVTDQKAWFKFDDFDPWCWKDRVVMEKKAAYTKMLGKKLLFISMEWYPYFLAVYKPVESVEERYQDGVLGNMALQVYNYLRDNGPMGTHDIKKVLGITKSNKGKYESAIAELQGIMDITVFGLSKRINKSGEPYGWLSSEYCTVEQWAGQEAVDKAMELSSIQALEKIKARVRKYVPDAEEKQIDKFLGIHV